MNTTTPDPTVYVDPFPGREDDDLVEDLCYKCGGNGLYKAPTGIMIRNPRGGGTFAGCLACKGHGSIKVKVSRIRARDRKAAERAQAERDAAPLREWLAAERLHHQIVKAEAAAYAEQARRDALVHGFVGDVDAKVTNLDGVVTRAIEFPAEDHFNNPTTGRRLVITLADGKVVSWASATAAAVWSVSEGDTVRITSAIVKAHKNFRGQDQTELKNTRLKKA